MWDEAAGVKTGDLLTRFKDTAAERDQLKAARGDVPADAAGYELKFPEGYTPPAGVTLDPADPFLKDAQAFAKDKGWTKPQFEQAVALEAMRRAGMAKSAQMTHAAEMAKLGDNAPAVVADIKSRVGAVLQPARAAALMSSLHSAEAVLAVQELLSRGPKPGPAGGPAPSAFADIKAGDGASRLTAIRSRQAQAA